jgi:hypothetical protein
MTTRTQWVRSERFRNGKYTLLSFNRLSASGCEDHDAYEHRSKTNVSIDVQIYGEVLGQWSLSTATARVAGVHRLFDPHQVVVEKIEADAPFLAPFAFEYVHYGKTTFRVVIRAWELVPGVFGRVRF